MSDDETELDMKNLDKIIRALRAKASKIRVGILNNGGRGDGTTNAQIGAIHEFGTSKVPQRSFLRVPIMDHLASQLEDAGAFGENTLKQVINEKTIDPWLKSIATIAENIVGEAFATRGYGKWPGWKNPGYDNNSGMVLVDTGQLRGSISSDIKG